MGVEENNNKKLIVFKFNESKADVLYINCYPKKMG